MSSRKKSAKLPARPDAPARPPARPAARPTDSQTPKPATPAQVRPIRIIGLGGLTILAFGLLLWARLILVANPPRTAIAEPQADPHARAAAADLASQRQSTKSNAQKRRAAQRSHAAAQPNGTD